MLEIARDTDYYSLLVVAVYTGARRGEILGLRWLDVDWRNNLLMVRQTVKYVNGLGIFIEDGTKTENGIRDILAPEEVMEVLKQHKKEQASKRLVLGKEYDDHDLIFCQNDGKPIHPDTISSWFPEFLVAHDLPRIRFHDLRHTHATILLANKVPDLAISERLGHADPGITKRLYGHLTKSMQQEASEAIKKALTGGK